MSYRTTYGLSALAVLLLFVAFTWVIAVAEEPSGTPVDTSPAEVPEVSSIRVRLAEGLTDEPTSGRLYVFFSQRDRGQPMNGPNWFSPEPFVGMEVTGLETGQTVIVNDTAAGFPEKLSSIPTGDYRVQAILDHDFYEQNHARGVGNFYSDVVEMEWAPKAGNSHELVLQNTVASRKFPDRSRVREVVISSDLLSQFHGRDVVQRAAVVLPESYDVHPERRYPVLYIIPGFGGSHHGAARYLNADVAAEESESGEDRTEFIRVVLNPNCKWGHHVFADSATNGPRGQALVEEFIPHIDANYRTIAAPTARFVEGHSSGGWSSLWLQVNYPDVFGGVWSTAPDPVDFRDYQGVDLYADPPLSLYTDEEGEQRPIARSGEKPVLWYQAFGKMDDVLGRGGQLRSFEAVFSPLDDNGQPQQLWDRSTGQINPKVAEAWKAYDLRLLLEDHWEELEQKLRGKLHIVTGSLDSFYLNGAVERLAETLEDLGSDAEIVVVPKASHSSVLRSGPVRKMRRQMVDAFRKHHPTGS